LAWPNDLAWLLDKLGDVLQDQAPAVPGVPPV
jgi:hypothetical protein